MSRKIRRVPVSPDAGDIKQLSAEEIALILRGADDLIMRGGRNLLAKVLKGSREIKRETFATEMLARVDALIADSDIPPDLTWLNDRNREVVMLLDRIETTGDPGYLPALEAWSNNTYKKIRARIRRVMESLPGPDQKNR